MIAMLATNAGEVEQKDKMLDMWGQLRIHRMTLSQKEKRRNRKKRNTGGRRRRKRGREGKGEEDKKEGERRKGKKEVRERRRREGKERISLVKQHFSCSLNSRRERKQWRKENLL